MDDGSMNGDGLIVKTPKTVRNRVLPAGLQVHKITRAVFRGAFLKIVFRGAGLLILTGGERTAFASI